ncbi:hypothetical protein Hanom_Chr08g00751111 [Helianthus anomalus]
MSGGCLNSKGAAAHLGFRLNARRRVVARSSDDDGMVVSRQVAAAVGVRSRWGRCLSSNSGVALRPLSLDVSCLDLFSLSVPTTKTEVATAFGALMHKEGSANLTFSLVDSKAPL